MKTIIATTLVTLSLAAPAAAADPSSARAFFALGNDSAAERIVGKSSSSGDTIGTQRRFAASNSSPAETRVTTSRNRVTNTEAIRKRFALTNDSPAENR